MNLPPTFVRRSGPPDPQVSGFTLVEALVALLILGVIMAAVLPLFLANTQLNTTTERRAQAASAIETALDARRGQVVNSPYPPGNVETLNVPVGGVTYAVRLTYCRVASLCTDNSRMITADALYANSVLMSAETIFTEVNYVNK